MQYLKSTDPFSKHSDMLNSEWFREFVPTTLIAYSISRPAEPFEIFTYDSVFAELSKEIFGATELPEVLGYSSLRSPTKDTGYLGDRNRFR